MKINPKLFLIVVEYLHHLRYWIHIKNYGQKSYCPICNRKSYFIGGRPKMLCTYCESKERHRLLWLFFNKIALFQSPLDRKILHIAAESCFVPRFRRFFGKNYITADIASPDADVQMDITDIKYPEGSFNTIICSHVLEHVSDDRKALKEFYRTLKQGGKAIILVPISDAESTFEDSSITTLEGRRNAFLQSDHVRKYGKDFFKRLSLTANWSSVEMFEIKDIANEEEQHLMALFEDDLKYIQQQIYLCTK